MTTVHDVTPDLAAEQVAMASVPGRVVDAWHRHDASGFAGVFTEDGTMVLPGLYLKGREAIQAYMAEAFLGPYRGTEVTGTPVSISPLGTEAAVLVTEGGVLAAGDSEVAESRAIRASWVLVKRDGQWWLAAYHNCPAHAQRPPVDR